jgi:predicted oxidoreductase
VLQTIDPTVGRSEYDRAAYRRSATLTIPRDMALDKTKADLALRDQLKEALDAGVFTQELLRDMDVQADIQRTIEARDRTIESRLGKGRDVADLRAITDDAIARAAHYQQAELFDAGRKQRSPIADADDKELDEALDPWRLDH